MIMKSIRIQNYKCFKDTGTIVLDPNMNVLVGKNNTGKTAYTEALSLRFTDDPHLSKETSTFRGTQPTGHSIVEVVFSFVLDEIYQLLLGRTWSFRRPNDINPQDYLSHVKDLFSSREIIFTAIYDDRRVINAYFPDLYHPKYGTGTAFKFDRNPNNIKIVEEKRSISSNSTPWDDFASLIRDQSVLLCSERFKQGQSPLRGDSKIKSDSSNLPDVLHTLATNEIKRFNKIKRLIKVIFPEVKNVSIPTIGDPKNLVKIHLDDNDSLNDRSDLCIPLQESGTGISQALSIIVAAVNTDFPRTIIIEDPQVFLHPSASRKLIHILRNETKNNQYIITTHSPIILNSSQPCTILKSSKYRRVGKINSFSSDSQIEVGDILREIGARPSDLFGADRILWVEGPTEQEIYRLIIEQTQKLRNKLSSTAILPINNVGELSGKHKQKVLSIYKKLCGNTGIITPNLAFIFDREDLTDRQINDFKKTSDGNFWFLKRRMIENYLLNINALTLFMEKNNNSKLHIQKEKIDEWFVKNGTNKKYFTDKAKEYKSFKKDWYDDVDGANLLNDLFKDLIKDEYRKTSYGPELAKILLSIDISYFSDLIIILESAMKNLDSRKIKI